MGHECIETYLTHRMERREGLGKPHGRSERSKEVMVGGVCEFNFGGHTMGRDGRGWID